MLLSFRKEDVMKTNDNPLYNEIVSSKWTEVLFLALTVLCFLLFVWRGITSGLDIFGVVFFCLFAMFLFYSVNYRTLIIRMTKESLKLIFGIAGEIWRGGHTLHVRPSEIPCLLQFSGT